MLSHADAGWVKGKPDALLLCRTRRSKRQQSIYLTTKYRQFRPFVNGDIKYLLPWVRLKLMDTLVVDR